MHTMDLEHPNKISRSADHIIELLEAGTISRRQAKSIAKKATVQAKEAMEFWGPKVDDWYYIFNETLRKLSKI